MACSVLGAPATKEGSYQAANDWWRKKRAEINGQEAARHPHADQLQELAEKLAYANRNGLNDEAADLADLAARVKELGPDDPPQLSPEATRLVNALDVLGVDTERLDLTALEMLFGGGAVWTDRMRREQAVPADKTIGALAKKWSADRANEAVKGVRSADGADNMRISLDHFVTFAGATTAAESIDADLWGRWHTECRSQIARRNEGGDGDGWADEYAKKVFGVARSFVKWLWERSLCELPRNLEKLRIEVGSKAIPIFSDAEIKLLLDGATGQHKLHLLLMLNTGMTQKDISDLRKDQIDLDAGTITRRRSKTKNQRNVPVVCYPLWPVTVALLREHLSDDPIYALLTTKSNKRWVRKEMVGGHLKKADNIATLFQHLRRKVNLKGKGKSLKVFRKTSATRLKGSKEYRDLRYYFLGHSDRTVADRNYAAESQTLMDEAIKWLGKQYGLI